MTLTNNRAPLLINTKRCASFHHHMSIQSGVGVQKRLNGFLTSVTLTFDIWPWPFAWTSLLSLVITLENFMIIRWQKHCEKGAKVGQTDRQTNGQTDGRTDRKKCSKSCLVAAEKQSSDRGQQVNTIRKTPDSGTLVCSWRHLFEDRILGEPHHKEERLW